MEYSYTKLDNLHVDTKIYNIYGVVKYFREPRRTKGPDWNMTVVITDQSLGWDGKIVCNLFLKDLSLFPPLTRVGDLVRFHRVKTKLHDDKLQCLACPGFAALVFDRESDLEKPKSTKPNYTYTEKDRFMVNELISWSSGEVGQELENNVKNISDVTPNLYFDLHCQVIGHATVDENHMIFKVWDGTKPKPNIEILKAFEDSGTSVQYEGVIDDYVRDYLVDVSVFDDHVKEADHILLADYVSFNNLHAMVPVAFRHQNQNPGDKLRLELCLHQGSTYGRSVRALSDVNAVKLRTDLNQILHSINGKRENTRTAVGSTSPQPSTSTAGNHGNKNNKAGNNGNKRDENESESDVVSSTLDVLEPLLSMEVNQYCSIWSITKPEEDDVIHLSYLSQLNDYTGIQRVKLVAHIEERHDDVISTDDVMKSLVVFCQHCHFMSSVPVHHLNQANTRSRDRKRDVILPRMHRAFVANQGLGRASLGTMAEKCNVSVIKRGRVEKEKTKSLMLPVSSFCRSVFNLKKVKLRPGDWMLREQPCLRSDTGSVYYTCPHCTQNEADPCVLKYKFYSEWTMSDFTGSAPVSLWEDCLNIDGAAILARDVITNNALCTKYRNWYKQVMGSTAQVECTIKIHQTTAPSTKLYQILKVKL